MALSNIATSAIAGGPAAAAIATVKEVISGAINAIKEAGAKVQGIIKDTVAAFRPAEILRLAGAVADLRAVFGQMFLPIVVKATEVVREISRWFYNLSPSIKQAIGVIAGITVVFGLVAGAASTIVGVATLLATVFVALASPLEIVAALIIGIGSQTGLFAQALQLGEQALRFFINGLCAVWEQLAPVRAELTAAFRELRGAFAELFEAVRPIAAILVGTVLVVIKQFIMGNVILFTKLAQVLTLVVRGTTMWINALLKFVGLSGIRMPELAAKKKDPYGLGQHSAEIGNDLSGLKNRIEEKIIELQGGGPETEAEGPDLAQQSVTLLGEIRDKLINLPTAIATALRQGAQNAASGAASGSAAGGGSATGVVRGIFGI